MVVVLGTDRVILFTDSIIQYNFRKLKMTV